MGRVLAVLVALLLTACGAATGADQPGASANPRPTASPAPTGREVQRLPVVDEAYERLDAGRYELSLPPFLTTAVDIPADWSVSDGHLLGSAPFVPGGMRFFISVTSDDAAVPVHPCRDHQSRVVGVTPRSLAVALADLPLVEAGPVRRTSVGGHPGAFVRLTVPDDAEVDHCLDGEVRLWSPSAPAGDWRVLGPGRIARLWILDAVGERVVIQAESLTNPTAEQEETLLRMGESTTFSRSAG